MLFNKKKLQIATVKIWPIELSPMICGETSIFFYEYANKSSNLIHLYHQIE